MAKTAADLICEACAVRDRALCSALSADELATLNRHSIRRSLARGDLLFREGDDALCGNLIAGILKLADVTADGDAQTVALLFPGDFIGGVSAAPRHDIVALSAAQVCLFPRALFASALESHRRMEKMLLARTHEAMENARGRLTLLLRGSAEARVEALLADLAAYEGSPTFDLPITRGDMADALGLTLETVSRVMSRLKARGRLETQGPKRVRFAV